MPRSLPSPSTTGRGRGVSLKNGRVLSNLAGAAEYLKEALLVNPYDLDGMAQALDRALRMPGGERRERLAALKARIEALDVQGWAERFLASLEEG